MKNLRPFVFFSVLSFLLSVSLRAQDYDKIREASSAERCSLAQQIFREQLRTGEPGEKRAVEELMAFAVDKGDRCLELHCLMFIGALMDAPEVKDEDSVLAHFQKELNYAKRYDFKKEEAEITYRQGLKYYHLKTYPQAFEHLLKAYEMFQEVGFSQFEDMNFFLYNLGKVYFEFGDYHRALRYLKESTHFPFGNNRAEIHTYNTLGLTYYKLHEVDTSLYYYDRAIGIAKRSRDSVWIGILSGNKATVMLKEGLVKEAKPLIRLDYALSKRYGEWNSAANCLILLAEMHMDDDSLAAAEAEIREVESLFEKTRTPQLMRDYFRHKGRLSYLKGDYKFAYALQDSFLLYKDRISAENDQDLLRTTEIKVQTEEYLSKIQLLESERKQAQALRNFILVLAFFVAIIAYLVINSQRLKRKKDHALLMLEKQQAQEELKIAENALQGYMNSLLEKNRLIDKFRAETEDLRRRSEHSLSPENEQILEKLYQATILTEEDWINFKRMFEKVHADFFVRLKEKYPDLTVAETRLIVLTKLNLSVTEIANMLGISPDSVRKTGSRMRKKLNLQSNTDIADIASDI